MKWILKKTLQVLSGETAWVLTDHLAGAPGFQKKVQDFFSLHFVQKYETLSNIAYLGELSVVAGQQVELLETREEQVSNSIFFLLLFSAVEQLAAMLLCCLGYD